MRGQLEMFEQTVIEKRPSKKVVNVSSVPQRSPFRYPGGKTWLIPTVRKWLAQDKKIVKELIEPFAGGGIVSLTAAFESLAEKVLMIEFDPEIAAVWDVLITGKSELFARKILNFDLTRENVIAELENEHKRTEDIAFCTILKNRVYHGGIIAKGSGMLKHGENGKGIQSRWYPKTLHDRILAINEVRHKIRFNTADAFEVITNNIDNKDAFFFIDPPYTVAGKRLYTYFDIDHEKLFELTSQIRGRYLLTYDDTPEIRLLAKKYSLKYKTIPMKTTHHLEKNEILISDNHNW